MKSIILILFALLFFEVRATTPAKKVARNLIAQYKNALNLKSKSKFFEATSEHFKLFACGRQNNYLTRDQIFDSISTIPQSTVDMNFINVTEAAFFRFGAMQIRTIINGLKVNFDAQRQDNGRYALTMEYNRDCPPIYPPLTTLSVDYYGMAKQFATNLMFHFVNGIKIRSLLEAQYSFLEPYTIQYCDMDHEYQEMEIEKFNLSMFPISSSQNQCLTRITNAILCRNGSLTFEVHGGAFNNYYEAVIDNLSWKISLDRRLECSSSSKNLNFELYQDSVFQ